MVKKNYTDFSFKRKIFLMDSPYKRSGCNSCSGSLNVHKQDTIHSQFQSSSPHTGVYKGASKLSERPDKMLMEGGGGVWGTVMV